jgi:hypothetical protein
MPEALHIGTYWLARRESAEACARRAERLFRLLSRLETTWTGWHDTEDDKARWIDPDAATFERLFKKKKYRDGPDGFGFCFWVGDTLKEATSVNTRCGASTPRLPSVCVLTLPQTGAVAERVLTARGAGRSAARHGHGLGTRVGNRHVR